MLTFLPNFPSQLRTDRGLWSIAITATCTATLHVAVHVAVALALAAEDAEDSLCCLHFSVDDPALHTLHFCTCFFGIWPKKLQFGGNPIRAKRRRRKTEIKVHPFFF